MTLPPVLHSAWCGLALAEQAGGFAPPLMAPTTCGRQPFFLGLFRSHLRWQIRNAVSGAAIPWQRRPGSTPSCSWLLPCYS